ncbi:MAG: YeeE/YedE family protein [Nitrospirae bacterium]|nr:YeeE/YedE family protein [Nitrospirota bacterium]
MHDILIRLRDTFDPSTIGYFFGPDSLYGGFIIGAFLGIVLQKGKMCKYGCVSGMFRLWDFTFFRVGTPLLMAGMILIYFFRDAGAINLYLPHTVVLAQLVGGIIFGAGLAISGYCPAIAAGALGEGALDSLPTMAGFVAGSIAYAELFDGSRIDKLFGYTGLGRVSFPDIFLVFNHWFFILAFVVMCAFFLMGITFYDEFLRASFAIIGKAARIVKK